MPQPMTRAGEWSFGRPRSRTAGAGGARTVPHRAGSLSRFFFGLGLVLALAWTLTPLLYLAALSVKPERLMLESPQFLFRPTFERYWNLFAGDALGGPMATSFLTATFGTLGALFLGGLAAFGFAFLEFRWKRSIFFVLLVSRMFPPVTTLIPVYLILKAIALIDTRTGLILLFAGFQVPLVTWILRAYLDGIPRELLESAALDGASLPVLATRIVLPLAGPGLISAAILSFIFSWNEFVFPLVVTSFNAKTGAVAIMNYTEQQINVQWGPLGVVGVVMSLPVILFMLGLRTYLTKGLTAGALQG